MFLCIATGYFPIFSLFFFIDYLSEAFPDYPPDPLPKKLVLALRKIFKMYSAWNNSTFHTPNSKLFSIPFFAQYYITHSIICQVFWNFFVPVCRKVLFVQVTPVKMQLAGKLFIFEKQRDMIKPQ